MKNLLKGAAVFALLAVFLAGCELPSQPAASTEAGTGARDVNTTYTSGPFYDASGKVETWIHWMSSNWGQENTVTVYVQPDEVLVGGGAFVIYDNGTPGAFLTSSFPYIDPVSGNAIGWMAQSRYHIWSCNHYVTSYVVGMKLKDANGNYIPKSTVQQYVRVDKNTSGRASHPGIYATAPSGWEVISGGAQVWFPFGQDGINIYGNLLTQSRPSGGLQWYAASKDHIYPSPAMITAYAISMYPDIPNFGHMDIVIRGWAVSTSSNNAGNNQILKDSGYCSVGAGGYTVYNGYGRMLTFLGLYTNNAGSCVGDADHGYPDYGSLGLNLIEIKKR
jgi:hypothetical protein